MQFIHFLFVLLVTGFSGAQLPDIPPCSLKCFIDTMGNDGCTPLTNFKCHCKQPGLTAKITPCVNKSCDKAEQSSVSNIVVSQCSAAGVPISIPPVEGEATTTTTTAPAAPTETKSVASTESSPKTTGGSSPTETSATAPKTTESGAPSSTETGASPTGSSIPAIPSGSASGSGSGSVSTFAPVSPTGTESHGKGTGAAPSTTVPVIHNGAAGFKSSLVAVAVVAGAAVYVL